MKLVLACAVATITVAGLVGSAVADTSRSRVTVRLAFTNNGGDVSGGGVAGRGRFVAKGGIRDRGNLVVYRTRKGSTITLRFAVVGRKGRLTFLVKIDTTAGTSRWTIASGTRRYRGLNGTGVERENATYTVSTLTGFVWR